MRGKIILVPFPFSEDFSVTKPRPAICLTDVIGKNDELIIAYITSKPETENLCSDITLENFEKYGLKTLSKIKLHKLVTITVD
jgi:mRNA interferase MazF